LNARTRPAPISATPKPAAASADDPAPVRGSEPAATVTVDDAGSVVDVAPLDASEFVVVENAFVVEVVLPN
jgi:hypothetical protein